MRELKRYLWFLVTFVLIAGTWVARLPQLDQRPMHGDEANQAVRTGILMEERTYHYDPNDHHGPVMYFATLPFCWATAQEFADTTEWNFRLVPVCSFLLTLLLMVGLSMYTRHHGLFINAAGLWTALLLTGVSPALFYYSRFYIQETFLVTFLTGMLFSGVCYVSARLRRQGAPSVFSALCAVAFGICTGLAAATKETMVLSVAAAALALLTACGWRRFKKYWHTRDALLAVGAAALVAVLFFSSFFTHPRGVYDALFSTVSAYLTRATAVPEHQHPWNFYLKIAFWFKYGRGPLWSEAALLLPATLVAVVAWLPQRWRRRLVQLELPEQEEVWALSVRFLVTYTVALTVIYSAIPYKTPWCILSFLHGYILLAGIGIGCALHLLQRQARWLRWPGQSLLLAAVLLMAHHHWTQAQRAAFTLPADPRNPFVYAHAGRDALRLVAEIETAAENDRGYQTPMAIAAPPADTWPLPWYLRKYKQVGYWLNVAEIPAEFEPEILVVAADQGDVADARFGVGKQATFYGVRPGILVNLFVPAVATADE